MPVSVHAGALEAFAAHAGSNAEAVRAVTGSRAAVEAFWSRAAAAFPRPSAVRKSQPLYVIERPALRFTRDDADVARATLAEVDEIGANSAQMIAGEVGADPRANGFDIRIRTARLIEAGWWWRYRRKGRLAFMCHVSARTAAVAQIQGVWSPPQMRGRGLATRALGAICDHLLDEVGALVLNVNSFNAAAIALYERVGFSRAGEFQTIIFGGKAEQP